MIEWDRQGVAADEIQRRVASGEDLPELWAEHAEVAAVFGAMQTQWRSGMAGATGLDYAALPIVQQALGVKPAARKAMFGDVQLMEREALKLMRHQHGQ